jgi:putative transposase
MCSTLGVSRSGFYAWLKRQDDECPRVRENRRLTARITEIHTESRQTYGAPRIHAALQRSGETCGLNRVVRLMKAAGIRAYAHKKFRVSTTDSNHSLPIAENLLEGCFYAGSLNEIWVADITYIPTGEGWLYLASILDLCSRKIVGWSLQATMKTKLVLAALEMALGSRRPPAGLIHHSDRGSQYAAKAYRDALDEHGLVPSMSGKGNCYDNAVKESFFHTLKTELVHRQQYPTREKARASIFEYIEVFYNRQRLHSSLDYRSPVEFEEQIDKAA